MASMWEHATPLTSCPALENRTGAGKGSGVRQERGRRRRRSPPGMGRRRDCPTLPAGRSGSNELASCAPLPLPQELGRPAGLGQQLIQEQGLGGQNSASWGGGGIHRDKHVVGPAPGSPVGKAHHDPFYRWEDRGFQAVTCPGPLSC